MGYPYGYGTPIFTELLTIMNHIITIIINHSLTFINHVMETHDASIPFTNIHQSSIIDHQSSIINHQSSIINHQSSSSSSSTSSLSSSSSSTFINHSPSHFHHSLATGSNTWHPSEAEAQELPPRLRGIFLHCLLDGLGRHVGDDLEQHGLGIWKHWVLGAMRPRKKNRIDWGGVALNHLNHPFL